MVLALPIAYDVVRYAGAAYLVWLGLKALRSGAPPLATQSLDRTSRRVMFRQGVLTNILNPKVALFFLAFLPQFIAPDAPHKALAFLFLGCVFNFNATLWNLFVAWSAARIARSVKDSRAMRTWVNRTIGGVFIYLGVRLATVAH